MMLTILRLIKHDSSHHGSNERWRGRGWEGEKERCGGGRGGREKEEKKHPDKPPRIKLLSSTWPQILTF